MLEYCIREDLKLKKTRMMAALDPVKLVIDNYPEGEVEYLEVPNNLENESLGSRQVPFCRELYIDREDNPLGSSAVCSQGGSPSV